MPMAQCWEEAEPAREPRAGAEWPQGHTQHTTKPEVGPTKHLPVGESLVHLRFALD